MNGLVDLHCHILYGVDDGAQSLEDSLEMGKALVELGFSVVAASPHNRPKYAPKEMAITRMNELQAAIGLLQLRDFDEVLSKRRQVDEAYRAGLFGLRGIRCLPSVPREGSNYSYFPILVEPSFPLTRDQLYNLLKSQSIHCRRYFYPLISDFPMYRGLPSASNANLPIAARIAQQVLCLPIYPDLDPDTIKSVIDVMVNAG